MSFCQKSKWVYLRSFTHPFPVDCWRICSIFIFFDDYPILHAPFFNIGRQLALYCSIGVMPYVPQPCVRQPVCFELFLPDGRHLSPLGLASALGALLCSLQILRNVSLTNIFDSVVYSLFKIRERDRNTFWKKSLKIICQYHKIFCVQSVEVFYFGQNECFFLITYA